MNADCTFCWVQFEIREPTRSVCPIKCSSVYLYDGGGCRRARAPVCLASLHCLAACLSTVLLGRSLHAKMTLWTRTMIHFFIVCFVHFRTRRRAVTWQALESTDKSRGVLITTTRVNGCFTLHKQWKAPLLRWCDFLGWCHGINVKVISVQS